MPSYTADKHDQRSDMRATDTLISAMQWQLEGANAAANVLYFMPQLAR